MDLALSCEVNRQGQRNRAIHDVHKIRYRFFQKHDNSVRYCGDAKTTKLHVGKVQAQTEKKKNDTCVVQTHVSQKKIKWVE